MSELIHPDAALVPLLKRIAAGDLKYSLFFANVTPTKASVLSDFTTGDHSTPVVVVEADFTLDGVAGHKGTIIAAPIALPNDTVSAQTAYGYFIMNSAGTELLGALRFATPVAMAVSDTHNVTPILGDSSFYPV